MSRYRRTQIYLSEDQVMMVRETARSRDESMSDVIRQAIDQYLANQGAVGGEDPIDRLVGQIDVKASDVSARVDDYLYGPSAGGSREGRPGKGRE